MRMLHLESRENMRRVGNLIYIYEQIEEKEIGEQKERSDILRAAVVLMHASIEEIVRNLFVDRLPNAKVEALNELAYPPYGAGNRAKGVFLGDLLKNHGGRFVENVIIDAIHAHVDVLNINNSDQLVANLKKVSIKTERLTPFLAASTQ